MGVKFEDICEHVLRMIEQKTPQRSEIVTEVRRYCNIAKRCNYSENVVRDVVDDVLHQLHRDRKILNLGQAGFHLAKPNSH